MLNPSDKELDRLSREAADHFEPDEQISSWEQLVPRLDREIGVKPNAGFRIFGRGPMTYAIAVLITAGLALFVMKQRQPANARIIPKTEVSASPSNPESAEAAQSNPSSKPENKKPNAEGTAGNSQQNAPSQTADGNSKVSSPAVQSNRSNDNSISQDKSSKNKEKDLSSQEALEPAQSQSASSSNPGDRTKSKQMVAGISTVVTSANTNEQGINNGQSEKGISKSNKNKVPQDISNTNPDAKAELNMMDIGSLSPAFQKETISTDFTLKKTSHTDIQLSKEAIAQSKNTQRALRVNRALKIGVLYGSDVTSVHSVAPDKLSQSWGMTLGYQFHNHWSVNTGLIYTQKNYSANGNDFHLKSTNMPTWSKLDYVDGNCNMWEIPLTLRYDFDRINNTTLFINGGASSYLMRHESYVFYGHTYYNGMATRWQSPNSIPYDTKENYLFSVIDFSVGVEQRISKSISLQVEPYVKIPVKGVGLGEVDLSSYGVNLSLRFAPLLKSTRK